MSTDPFEWGNFGNFGSFDDVFQRFFGGRDPFAASRRVQQVDLTQLLNDQARDLITRAASQAAAWGSRDLDAVHLLWASTQMPTTREQLQQAGVDTEALAKRIQQAMPRRPATDQVTSLSPAAKRVLLEHWSSPRLRAHLTLGRNICCWPWLITRTRLAVSCLALHVLYRAGCSPQHEEAPLPKALHQPSISMVAI